MRPTCSPGRTCHPNAIPCGARNRLFGASPEDYQAAERKANVKQMSFEHRTTGTVEFSTVDGAIDLYLASKKASGYTPKSLDKLELIFRDRLQVFLAQRGIVYLKDVKRSHLETWRSVWTGTATTKGKTQGRLKGFFDWAVKSDLIEKSPALGLERIKGARDVPPTMALTDAQFDSLLEAIGKLTHRSQTERDRLRALALLQRWSGLAIRDALTVKRAAFHKQPSGWYRLFLRRAKTGVDVYVSLAPKIAEKILSVPPVSELYLFWDGKEDKETLIRPYQLGYQRAGELADLKDENGGMLEFHSHMLRDTFAVWCFTQGMATEDVAALLGHRNIPVTQQHYSPWVNLRQERLGAIVKAAYAGWEAVYGNPCK